MHQAQEVLLTGTNVKGTGVALVHGVQEGGAARRQLLPVVREAGKEVRGGAVQCDDVLGALRDGHLTDPLAEGGDFLSNALEEGRRLAAGGQLQAMRLLKISLSKRYISLSAGKCPAGQEEIYLSG